MRSTAEFLLKADLVAGAALLLWGAITVNLQAIAAAGVGFIGNIVGHKAVKAQYSH